MSPPLLKQVVEALLFASQKPLAVKEILAVLKSAAAAYPDNADAAALAKTREDAICEALGELAAECQALGRSFGVRETAGGWQLVTPAAFGPWLRQLYPETRPARLSAPAMETLSIIAYRQPITRADIEAVRGVAVDGVMQTLLDRGLVKIAGRADVPGRPLLYETTHHFMEHFGLRTLDELPNADELRRAAAAAIEEKAAAKDTAAPARDSGSAPGSGALPPNKDSPHPQQTSEQSSAAPGGPKTSEPRTQ